MCFGWVVASAAGRNVGGGWVAGRPGIGSVFWIVNVPVAEGVA